MKKIYQSPETTVVLIDISAHLLINSMKVDAESENAVETGDILSRRNENINIWDDDDE